MFSSLFSYVCISNNPNLVRSVSNADLICGTALSVLIKGRDLVHSGWELIANPLYGNFKPNQQPYRTLVLGKDGQDRTAHTHLCSLELIEEAIAVYSRPNSLRMPGELPVHIDEDFMYVDFTLMEETLRQCGLLQSVMTRMAGR